MVLSPHHAEETVKVSGGLSWSHRLRTLGTVVTVASGVFCIKDVQGSCQHDDCHCVFLSILTGLIEASLSPFSLSPQGAFFSSFISLWWCSFNHSILKTHNESIKHTQSVTHHFIVPSFVHSNATILAKQFNVFNLFPIINFMYFFNS